MKTKSYLDFICSSTILLLREVNIGSFLKMIHGLYSHEILRHVWNAAKKIFFNIFISIIKSIYKYN